VDGINHLIYEKRMEEGMIQWMIEVQIVNLLDMIWAHQIQILVILMDMQKMETVSGVRKLD
jgi:hypothetical protein